MNLQHASYRYPTHLVPLLDLALTVLVLVLAAWLWRRSVRRRDSWTGRLWRRVRRAAASPARTLAWLFLLGVAASASTELVLGPPVPRVVDEFSYLFAAETFAHGHLTNPSNPQWRHFEAVHVLSEPSHQSKYPPAQGLVLALGVLVGHPSAALWLMSGLLTAAVAWLLRFWLPPPWPLVGALAVLFRVGVGSYWNQSYWGGSVAAVAGILVLGGARWCQERPAAGGAVAFGLGLLLLAASRPFEGLLFALPFVGAFAWRLAMPRESRGSRLARVGLPLALLLAAGAVAMGLYNRAVTGHPLRLPHQLYSDVYKIGTPHFIWSVHGEWPWWRVALELGTERTALALFFTVGLLGCLLAVAALPALRPRRATSLRLAGTAATLVLAGHFVTRPFFAHYSAPMACVVVLLAMIGLRRVTVGMLAAGREGRLLPLAFVAVQIVLCVVQLPAHRPDAESSAGLRETVRRHLDAEPGRDLVFLCSAAFQDDWMLNPPDLERAPVLWARELSPAENASLVAAFPDRRIWHLEQTQDGITLRPESHDSAVVFTAP